MPLIKNQIHKIQPGNRLYKHQLPYVFLQWSLLRLLCNIKLPQFFADHH